MKKTITRRAFVGVTASMALGACAKTQEEAHAPAAEATSTKIAIVHTNDTNGALEATEESLGIAAVPALVEDLEEEGFEVVVVDGGNSVAGTSLVDISKGTSAIELMNLAGYQAMALGEHDFDYGQKGIRGFVEQAAFPLLSANVIVSETGEPLVERHATLELASGATIGVFGLTSPETADAASSKHVEGLEFVGDTELFALVQEVVDELRAAGCDYVVCLSHLGDADTDTDSTTTAEVVGATHGIDLVVAGHDGEDSERQIENDEGTLVCIHECAKDLASIGVVRIVEGDISCATVKAGEYKGEDAQVAAAVAALVDGLEDRLGEVVATSEVKLNGEREPGIRTQETNLGDLVSDAMLWCAQSAAGVEPADCAIVNAGSIRASLGPGELTAGDVCDVFPYANMVVVVTMSGERLLEDLEAATQKTPEAQAGFAQVAGITYTIDTTKPFEAGEPYPNSTGERPAAPGTRVTIAEVGGEPFDAEASYRVAVSDFMVAGGDGHYAIKEVAATEESTGERVSDALAAYLKVALAGTVGEEYEKPEGQERIKIVS